ncbi:MAG: S1/P1 nuclease [Fibrobacteria bacterium]|nr:S1/P1 nuclease [Fibrobacteria bacterium]
MNRMVLIISLLAVLVGNVLGFGKFETKVIASVAHSLLTPHSQEIIARIIGNDGVLPDVAQCTDTLAERLPYTAAWHFVDIPLRGTGYLPDVHDKQENAVTVLRNYIKILRHSATMGEQKKEALTWIINLVGDLHQPLKVAEDNYQHGKKLVVHYRGSTFSLHDLWDFALVSSHYKTPKILISEMSYMMNESDSMYYQNTTFLDWVNGTLRTAAGCYLVDGDTIGSSDINMIPPSYSTKSILLIKNQIKLASIRLAWLLNQTLDSEPLFAPLKYNWSAEDDYYHGSICPMVSKIKPQNMKHSDIPPRHLNMHKACERSVRSF